MIFLVVVTAYLMTVLFFGHIWLAWQIIVLVKHEIQKWRTLFSV